MKKLLSITLTTLLVLFASQAFGQTQDEDNLTASAEVLTAIDVTQVSDLAFGTLFQGQTATLEIDGTDGSLNSTNAGQGASTANLGQFTISGSEGLEVQIVFEGDAVNNGFLVGNSTSSELPFSIDGDDYGRIQDADGADSNFNPSSSQTLDLGAGDVTILLGGEVTADATQDEDVYEGTVTLNANYTGF